MKDNKTKSYIMLISAMLIFGTIGIFRRSIPLSSGMLACLRGFIGAGFLILFMLITKKPLSFKIGRKNLALSLISGVLIGVNWILLFEAYNRTTVPVATLCYYMEPTFVILAAPLFLRERMTVKKLICVPIAIVGMVLVSGVLSGRTELQIDGILFGLGAAAVYAAIVLINKFIDSDRTYIKTVIQLGSAGAAMLPYLFFTEDFGAASASIPTVLLTLTLGIVHTGIAYALYFGSMRGLGAQSVAVLSYIDPIFALIFSALFLGESMSFSGAVGAIMIIGSALLFELNITEKRRT